MTNSKIGVLWFSVVLPRKLPIFSIEARLLPFRHLFRARENSVRQRRTS